MAEQHIRQSIDGSQNIFEKSLSRYREMLFENHPSKSVPYLYFDVWGEDDNRHQIDNPINKFTISVALICNNCNGHEHIEETYSYKLSCGRCYKLKKGQYLKLLVMLTNEGEGAAIEFRVKLGLVMRNKSVYQAICLYNKMLDNGTYGLMDLPNCPIDEFLLEGRYLAVSCEIKVIKENRHDASAVQGVFDLIPGLFSDANIDPEGEDDDLGDIVLVVEGHKVHCHKLILSTASKVFKKMLTSDMKEKHSHEIVLNDIKMETMKSLLTFIYSDKIDDHELTTELLAAADFYDLIKLKVMCEESLITTIDVSNVARYWHYGYLHSATRLECEATAFMAMNWKELIEAEDVRNLCHQFPNLTINISKLLSDK